ncbi:MAG: PAS domain S-box protein [Deltaproteobacteria bacterium]|nr:PAS domain S-box protein [Deltaproteobacteria bacterium]MBW2129086.1 PAS domain S-box protein [Deltaproteobacteria bacterium]
MANKPSVKDRKGWPGGILEPHSHKRKSSDKDPSTCSERAGAPYQSHEKDGGLYQAFVESTPDAVILYDPEGNVIYVNPAFTRTFGWALEEVKGKAVPFVPEAEKDEATAMIRGVVHEQKIYKDVETRRVTKDGRLLDVSISASRLVDPAGSLSGVVVTLRDISERKAVESRLIHTRKMEAVGTLAGGIAHEFNNILQAISGYTQILLMGKDPKDPEYRKLETIERASQKASKLTKQLLILGCKVPVDLKQVNLNESIKTACEALERSLPEKTSIELKLDTDLEHIQADPAQIEQVILNLGINAGDAMPGGGKIALETRNTFLDENYCRSHPGAVPGRYVQLTVTDSGYGMPEEIQEHIFEPFFTAKEAGEGTGLGLAVVYGIVKNHGGYICCRSLMEKGSAFDVFFPVQGNEGEGMRPEEGTPTPETAGSKETILLVDDEPIILEVAQDMLSHFGYRTLTASSGEQAIEIFGTQGNHIDLVILDLNMPGMGGTECLDKLLSMDPGVKVLMASGYSTDGNAENCLEKGAVGYIAKPFKCDDLLRKLREVLDTTMPEGQGPST